MIGKIPNLPNNILGFTARGEVTAQDYESVIIPAVDALFPRDGRVRFFYHPGKDFSGFDAGVVWGNAKSGLKQLTGWEKVDIVSAVEWIGGAIRVFGVVIPGQVRIFHNSELSRAVRWISG